jgi:hypothetical protein
MVAQSVFMLTIYAYACMTRTIRSGSPCTAAGGRPPPGCRLGGPLGATAAGLCGLSGRSIVALRRAALACDVGNACVPKWSVKGGSRNCRLTEDAKASSIMMRLEHPAPH